MSYDPKQHALEIAGGRYICVRCSDVDRDGMYLELRGIDDEDEQLTAEIFYSDQTAEMTMTLFRKDVPLPVIEWILAEAKEALPPIVTEPER